MKVAIIGYGKMGKQIESRLLEMGHSIVAVVDPYYQSKDPLPSKAPLYTSLEGAENLSAADLAMEFTTPEAARDNILFCAKHKVPLVVGTTGWFDHLQEITGAVLEADSSLVWAPNFSLGVNLFYRVAGYTAALMDPFPEYDVGGFESHHNKKADSPSGTAKTLCNLVLAVMSRKKKAVYEILDRPVEKEELHFPSLRVGFVPGTHSLIFDSLADTIEITHTARSRDGLVSGAIVAAQWLNTKKRTGVFTIDDVLAELLPSGSLS